MRLYKSTVQRNCFDVANQLRKATGQSISSNYPHGFDAIVNFNLGDVFIDNELSDLLTNEMCMELDECLLKLIKGDYGTCSDDEIDENNENRYFGNGEVKAKYVISVGEISIDKSCTHTKIFLLKRSSKESWI